MIYSRNKRILFTAILFKWQQNTGSYVHPFRIGINFQMLFIRTKHFFLDGASRK